MTTLFGVSIQGRVTQRLHVSMQGPPAWAVFTLHTQRVLKASCRCSDRARCCERVAVFVEARA